MFIKEDKTFHELRERSVQQWLDEMGRKDDLEVRGGVKATADYIEGLKAKILQLEKQNTLKDTYLKRIQNKQLQG